MLFLLLLLTKIGIYWLTISNRLMLDVKLSFDYLQKLAVSIMLGQIDRMTGFFVEAHTIRYMMFDS